MPDGGEVRRDALDFLFHVGVVEVLFDIFELVVVVGLFDRPPSRYNNHLIDLFKIEQPIGDIDHDITHADDRNPPADLESPLAERRQGIVVIDDILRVINTDGTEAHGFEIVQCQSLVLSDCHVTEIKDFGIGENFFKLLTQSRFHFLFFDINAVFG